MPNAGNKGSSNASPGTGRKRKAHTAGLTSCPDFTQLNRPLEGNNTPGPSRQSSSPECIPAAVLQRPFLVQGEMGPGATVTAQQLDTWFADVLRLEQQLGPNHLQVGKLYLFLSRVLHSLGTAPALRKAQNTLQRAHEIMALCRLERYGTRDIPCAKSFQYLFGRIQQKIESQQQAPIDGGVPLDEHKRRKF